MQLLHRDKPYNLDEAAARRGTPRRKRKDSRTTAYELTIRIPEERRRHFGGKKKLTRVVFALNKKVDLKGQVRAFEEEKNAVLGLALEAGGSLDAAAWAAMQSKVLKFVREVLNDAVDREHVGRNVAKKRFLSKGFRKGRPLIDPLMEDEAEAFLEEASSLPLDMTKVAVLILFSTGMHPEEMLAQRVGTFVPAEEGEDAQMRIVAAMRAKDRELHQVGQLDAHGPARQVHGIGRGGVDRGEETRATRWGSSSGARRRFWARRATPGATTRSRRGGTRSSGRRGSPARGPTPCATRSRPSTSPGART